MQDRLNMGLDPEQSDAGKHERDAVQEEFRVRLARKLADPEFRKLEGFPLASDEAILALSDLPQYAACPNPFIQEWVQSNRLPYEPSTGQYRREPFATDVSEGRGDPIYNAHGYHTKVPPKALMRYILHYTSPGDLVYDGFCGTGMTGVAAQLCGDRNEVKSLGYSVSQDGAVLDANGAKFSAIGTRRCVMQDLSSAATFIASQYCTVTDAPTFHQDATQLLNLLEQECGWLYTTAHGGNPDALRQLANLVLAATNHEAVARLYKNQAENDGPARGLGLTLGRITYCVWSDVLLCPQCGAEIVFWDAAVDENRGTVREQFACPSCRAQATKRQCARAGSTAYDHVLGKPTRLAKQVPVRIHYTVGKLRFEKRPDEHDLALVQKLLELPPPAVGPTGPMMNVGTRWGDTWRAGTHFGITHSHQFFTKRNWWVIASMHKIVNQARHLWLLTSILQRASKQHQIAITRVGGDKAGVGGATAGHRRGTLYVPSNQVEYHPLELLQERIQVVERSLRWRAETDDSWRISTASSTMKMMDDETVDYIIVDPPFGGNMMYAELNFCWEMLLGVFTNREAEAITSSCQKKGLAEYQGLMERCFTCFYRSLKPAHWMTVIFHNSANSVWNAIQEALLRAGFVVADVRMLNKQGKTHTQRTAVAAVDQDLVISCYKPPRGFDAQFREWQGQPEGVMEFVRQHLEMLPVAPVNREGRLEPVAERTRFLLFDRMVAYHLQRGARIPLSAAEFYKLLEEQFLPRDEMYFLPDQAARYDGLKARGMETEQFSLFLRDEKSAVQWVRARLNARPQTLGDLTPPFMQELREWPAHEPRPELRELLREYFIEDGGIWRVPDPDNERDLEALRRSTLLKLFREYAAAKGPLKSFRTEAVLEGFRHCWETRQYGVIVHVCEMMPAKVLQDIQEFVQFYDIAKDLTPKRAEQVEFVWE